MTQETVYSRLTKDKIGKFDISPHANLSGANLNGANLYWANLYGADLNRATSGGVEVIPFSYGEHMGWIIGEFVAVGCQCHTVEHWLNHMDTIVEECLQNSDEAKGILAAYEAAKKGD